MRALADAVPPQAPHSIAVSPQLAQSGGGADIEIRIADRKLMARVDADTIR
jgi:hypothetical protein